MPTELKVVMFTDQIDSTASTERRTHAEVEHTSEVLSLTRGVMLMVSNAATTKRNT